MAAPTPFIIKVINDDTWVLPNGLDPTATTLSFSLSDVVVAGATPTAITGAFSMTYGTNTVTVTVTESFALTSATAANRATLKADWETFKLALDDAETNKILQPGCARIVALEAGRYLPCMLNEVGMFGYNWCTSKGSPIPNEKVNYLDLQPGMRLLVQPAQLQNLPQGDSSIAGFGSTGPQTVTIGSMAKASNLTFTPTLNSTAVKVQSSEKTVAATITSVIDLQALAQPWCRLIYPEVPGFRFSAFDVPDDSPMNNISLLFASTYTNLKSYHANFDVVSTSVPNCCAVFAGRTAVIPQISVRVNNTQRFVAIGTTLRNLVERTMVSAQRPETLQMKRFLNGVATEVTFDTPTIGFDLQLLPGDQINW